MKEQRIFSLPYGQGAVTADLSDAASVRCLSGRDMPVIGDVPAALREGLEHPLGSRPLRELLKPEDKITVIISDLTRFWMRQDILCEELLRYLESIGIPDSHVTVLVALGSHRHMTDAELEKLSSTYVYRRCAVVNHDCDDPAAVRLGTTSFGTEVRVNPLAVGRRVIVISGTVHHLMAGYGGGRKSILPGISSRQTIRQNHRHALDPQLPRTSPLVGSGRLRGNPVNEDMREAAAMVAPVFGISVVADHAFRHSGLFCGGFDTAWEASCRFCQDYYGCPVEEATDVVIVSSGGYPKDMNLYQAVKALLNGARALKPGGTMVFLAECPEGGGAPDFFDWTGPLSRGTLDPELRERFTIAGYIFYASCEAIRRAGQFYLLSAIPPEAVSGMGMQAFSSWEALTARLDLRGKSVSVIPAGGSLVPQVTDDYLALRREVGLDDCAIPHQI